jgi:hypothetical protein
MPVQKEEKIKVKTSNFEAESLREEKDAEDNSSLKVNLDEKNNIIYFVVINGSKEMKNYAIEIIKRANLEFAKLGLQTRVALYNGTGDLSKADKNDGIAFFGSVEEVKKYASKINAKFGKIIKNWKGRTTNPEKSSLGTETYRYDSGYADGKNFIAMDSEAISKGMFGKGSNDALLGAFILMHGAGHNAQVLLDGENHKKWNHYGGILADAVDIDESVNVYHRKLEEYMNLNIYINPNISANESIFVPNSYWELARNPNKRTPFNDFGMRDGGIEATIRASPRTVPNLTYVYTMAKHFGTSKAKVNEMLGTIIE